MDYKSKRLMADVSENKKVTMMVRLMEQMMVILQVSMKVFWKAENKKVRPLEQLLVILQVSMKLFQKAIGILMEPLKDHKMEIWQALWRAHSMDYKSKRLMADVSENKKVSMVVRPMEQMMGILQVSMKVFWKAIGILMEHLKDHTMEIL